MHISVLLKESIDSLNIKEDGIYVDATLGYAGHAKEILKKIIRGCLFAFDQDKIAILYADKVLNKIGSNYTIIKSNFSNLKVELNKRNVFLVDGFLFDLGVSSPQLDEEERGFSYHKDAKLDMRMDLDNDFSAYDVVNNYTIDELTNIFYKYGEEKYSKSIAKNIVKDRETKKIETTFELVDIIKKSMPQKAMRDKHPARKVFQAIRIEVNNELDILEQSLKDAAEMLTVGGRLSVITFHSLEDKIVKKLFNELTFTNKLVKGLPNVPDEYLPRFKLIESISPTKEEIEENNRSRSSRLRVIEKIK
ncbi:MAG: 16S rRNA (cytosine(1402)-N(4))-methyltransferase RsmH [Bacilli bacterium]